jgi:hypothetical protein
MAGRAYDRVEADWMVIGLIGVALAMVVAGLVAIVSGSDGIGLESGWALVIAGSVASTGGVLVLALAFILRELRTLPDRLETSNPDEAADRASSPFENLAPVEQPHLPPVPQVVQGPGFARPVRPVEEPAAPAFARPVKPVEERSAPASRSGFAPRNPAQHEDAGSVSPSSAAISDEAKAAEPVDKAPPVFPDFSPRALLEASRSKAKGRAPQPDDSGEAVEPTVPIPADAMRGEDARVSPDEDSDVAGRATAPGDDVAKGLLAESRGGTGAEETATEVPAIVGTYRSNGTVYVMYADGSIEADTPEGIFRFGSLEELKAHIAGNAEASNDRRQPSPA